MTLLFFFLLPTAPSPPPPPSLPPPSPLSHPDPPAASKTALLGVPKELIEEHGAVSPEVAVAMAEGALELSNDDYAISVTGIAGPRGGTEEKPVGTVFIALAQYDQPTYVVHRRHRRSREDFKYVVSQDALEMARRRMLELPDLQDKV